MSPRPARRPGPSGPPKPAGPCMPRRDRAWPRRPGRSSVMNQTLSWASLRWQRRGRCVGLGTECMQSCDSFRMLCHFVRITIYRNASSVKDGQSSCRMTPSREGAGYRSLGGSNRRVPARLVGRERRSRARPRRGRSRGLTSATVDGVSRGPGWLLPFEVALMALPLLFIKKFPFAGRSRPSSSPSESASRRPARRSRAASLRSHPQPRRVAVRTARPALGRDGTGAHLRRGDRRRHPGRRADGR